MSSSSSPSSPMLLRNVQEMRQFVREKRRQNVDTCLSFVPTMGALHEGHVHLVRCARLQPSAGPLLVLVSIFVNPLQFGPEEDFARYPRTLAEDLAKLEGLADCVFVPEREELFGGEGEGEGIRVDAGRIGRVLEGRSRPGYFGGMLTVVAKLLNIVGPDFMLLGQKDAQQLFAIRQMVCQLNFPVQVVPVETQREPDGLAMSSRNRYLNESERKAALCLWKALAKAKMEAQTGASLGQCLAEARRTLEGEGQGGEGTMARLDYLEAVRAESFEQLEQREEAHFRGEAVFLVAAFVGQTRLIDNIGLAIGGGGREKKGERTG